MMVHALLLHMRTLLVSLLFPSECYYRNVFACNILIDVLFVERNTMDSYHELAFMDTSIKLLTVREELTELQVQKKKLQMKIDAKPTRRS